MIEEQMLAEEARRRGMSVTQLRMLLAVPTDLVKSIVRDQTRPSKVERSEPVVRGSGWVTAPKLGPPPGVEHCDRIADHFAELDRRERLRGR